jgi:hypothetical protein
MSYDDWLEKPYQDDMRDSDALADLLAQEAEQEWDDGEHFSQLFWDWVRGNHSPTVTKALAVVCDTFTTWRIEQYTRTECDRIWDYHAQAAEEEAAEARAEALRED